MIQHLLAFGGVAGSSLLLLMFVARATRVLSPLICYRGRGLGGSQWQGVLRLLYRYETRMGPFLIVIVDLNLQPRFASVRI